MPTDVAVGEVKQAHQKVSVVREEKAEWLLEDGWRELWVERYEEIWKPVDHGSVLAQKTENGE